MKTVSITGKTWDKVQTFIKQYAKDHNLSVSPESYLPLEDALGTSLDLYKPEALISVASFYPYFCRDGKTLKHIKVNFEEDCGIEDILKDLDEK